MNFSKGRQALLIAGLVAWGFAARTDAAVITGISSTMLPGASTGSVGPVGGAPVAPNNDNATGPSANVLPFNIFFNSAGLMEVEFNVANSGGTTEYRVQQSLLNITGQAWDNYHFELGFGTGANFVRSSALDFLDFDFGSADPAPFSSVFGTLDHRSDTMDWSNGRVNSIGAVLFTFAIDVPDGLDQLNPYGMQRFTLRQAAVPPQAAPVPEPTSLALLGTGLLGFAARVRRRRDSSARAARQ